MATSTSTPPQTLAQEKKIFLKIQEMSRSLLHNSEDAQDLSQEVFLELTKGRKKWEQADSQWAWAIGVLRRQWKRFLRTKKKYEYCSLENVSSTTPKNELEQQIILQECLEETLQVIQKLNPSIREALVLFAFEKKSIKEIAEIQKSSEGTVKWRIFEARRKIAQTVKS